LCECGRVVDAVADHGDDAAVRFELRDLIGFVAGQDFGDDGVDAELFADPLGRRAVVAGQHDDFDPGFVQRGARADCLLGRSALVVMPVAQRS
jgi:hypothetical protein